MTSTAKKRKEKLKERKLKKKNKGKDDEFVEVRPRFTHYTQLLDNDM